MEAALNDYKRLDYIQRHIATLKESIEYESTLELISSIYFASVFIALCSVAIIYMWHMHGSIKIMLALMDPFMQLGIKCARLLRLVSAGQL
jgi:hypothetical protein